MFHTETNADTRHLYAIGAPLWRLSCAIFTKINDRWARKDSKRKTIIVYSLNDQSLHYAITNTEGLVEFYYPEIAANKQTDFSYFSKSNTLKFRTKDAEYAITDTPGNLGISITTKDTVL